MFKLVLLLICLALRAANYVVIASAILSMVRTILRPRWTELPVVRVVIAIGETLCAPARALLEAFGVSPCPFDFSPIVTTAVLEILITLLSLLLR